MQQAKRQLGKVLHLKDCVSQMSKDQVYEQVLMPVWENGSICIKQQNLNPEQLKNLAEKMGNSIVYPKNFGFQTEPNHPEVVKIENNDNSYSNSQKPLNEPEYYWHHDGNFYPSPKNQILNMLHAKVVPKFGGQTEFLDMVSPLKDNFFGKVEQRLRRSQLEVQTKNIQAFKNISKIDQMPDQTHSVIQKHAISGQDSLYLPRNPQGLFDTKTQKHWISNEAIWQQLISGNYMYRHKWAQGDLLLWDNMQVQHRSLGGFGNQPRFLHRIQSRYDTLNKEDFYPFSTKEQQYQENNHKNSNQNNNNNNSPSFNL